MNRVILFILGFMIAAGIFVAPARSGTMPLQSSFKNIKVLTDMSDTDVRMEMQGFTRALGVSCTYCHEGSDFASDENPKKLVARKMITMVKTINKDFLGGKAACVLCHRGAAVPEASQ